MSITRVFLLLALTLLCASAVISAQSKAASSAQKLMVQQKYKDATKLVSDHLKSNPDDFDALYTLATIEQTRILDYESYLVDGGKFEKLADSTCKILQSRLSSLSGEDSIRCLFYTANLIGGIGVMQAKSGAWFDGVKNAVSSVGMLKEVKELDSDFVAADLGIGAFDYYLSTSFKWLPFVTEDKMEQGIIAIERALQAPFPFNHAAQNTLSWILIDRKQYTRADSLARSVLSELPDNTIFLRIRALIALWTGQYKSALSMSEEIIRTSTTRNPVNWSDLVTGYYIKVHCYEHARDKKKAYSAAQKILNTPIPSAYREIPHIKKHLKYLKEIRSKNRP
ncbi:MAG: tetratricopeptide repeat protein, partial [Fibrobacterota bacterium]